MNYPVNDVSKAHQGQASKRLRKPVSPKPAVGVLRPKGAVDVSSFQYDKGLKGKNTNLAPWRHFSATFFSGHQTRDVTQKITRWFGTTKPTHLKLSHSWKTTSPNKRNFSEVVKFRNAWKPTPKFPNTTDFPTKICPKRSCLETIARKKDWSNFGISNFACFFLAWKSLSSFRRCVAVSFPKKKADMIPGVFFWFPGTCWHGHHVWAISWTSLCQLWISPWAAMIVTGIWKQKNCQKDPWIGAPEQ